MNDKYAVAKMIRIKVYLTSVVVLVVSTTFEECTKETVGHLYEMQWENKVRKYLTEKMARMMCKNNEWRKVNKRQSEGKFGKSGCRQWMGCWRPWCANLNTARLRRWLVVRIKGWWCVSGYYDTYGRATFAIPTKCYLRDTLNFERFHCGETL